MPKSTENEAAFICKSDFSRFLVLFRQRNHRKSFSVTKNILREKTCTSLDFGEMLLREQNERSRAGSVAQGACYIKSDFYCPHFSPEVMVKLTRTVRGYFVKLIAVGMHLIECNPGQLPREEVESAVSSHMQAHFGEKFPLVLYWAHNLTP